MAMERENRAPRAGGPNRKRKKVCQFCVDKCEYIDYKDAAKLRRTQNGTAVTSFSVAVDRDFKSRESGEKATDFIDVVAWRQTAEFVCQYFTKGRMAVVEGRLQIRDWKDKDGNNRRSAEVVADNIYFGDSKRDSQSGGDYAPPAYGSPAESYTAPASGGFAEIEEDGELPF